MVENVFRELGAREGQTYSFHEVLVDAAKDVDCPIFYSVAVIVAGYLPIYALGGLAGRLFRPMADTVSIALVGALILTLTFVPVMCAFWFRKGVHERVNKPFEQRHPHRDQGGFTPAPAAYHDDRTGRLPGTLAGSPFHRHRFGYVEALCCGDRGGPRIATLPRLLRQPGLIRDGCARRRCAAGVITCGRTKMGQWSPQGSGSPSSRVPNPAGQFPPGPFRWPQLLARRYSRLASRCDLNHSGIPPFPPC